ncbi:MAG: hypothetical protein C4332_16545, partial [Meiothermus sp.]
FTERKRAEAALRESAEHYRHRVELSPQVPWTADPEGNITDVNQRWTDLTGMSREETLGDGWARAAHPDDLPRSLEAWSHSLRTGEPLSLEHRFRMRDGSYCWMHSRAAMRRGGWCAGTAPPRTFTPVRRPRQPCAAVRGCTAPWCSSAGRSWRFLTPRAICSMSAPMSRRWGLTRSSGKPTGSTCSPTFQRSTNPRLVGSWRRC